MDTPQYKELQRAAAIFRQVSYVQMDLDYSVYSVKNLDDIFMVVFKDGKLKYPAGKFAKNKGQILLGLTGYLTEVILKNTTNTKLHIDPTDKKWYLNFTLTAENGATTQPAQQILKRISQGNQAALYPFCLATVKAFNQPGNYANNKNINLKEVYFHDEANKKRWWKFW